MLISGGEALQTTCPLICLLTGSPSPPIALHPIGRLTPWGAPSDDIFSNLEGNEMRRLKARVQHCPTGVVLDSPHPRGQPPSGQDGCPARGGGLLLGHILERTGLTPHLPSALPATPRPALLDWAQGFGLWNPKGEASHHGNIVLDAECQLEARLAAHQLLQLREFLQPVEQLEAPQLLRGALRLGLQLGRKDRGVRWGSQQPGGGAKVASHCSVHSGRWPPGFLKDASLPHLL